MADFRKYALAFAGVACFMGITGSASAQTLNGITCFANASTPLQDRAEGITELVGDLVLSCTGGTVTPFNQPVPTVNITVALNTQVTSRLVNNSTTITESILMIDDYAPGSQVLCPATAINNFGNFTCATQVNGSGLGGGSQFKGTYNGANVYQGILTAQNQITFFNVPVDPPGPQVFFNNNTNITPTLTLRITNVRANASALGAPTGFTTSNISESVSTSAGIPISNPLQNVGSVFQGLVNKTVTGATLANATGFTAVNNVSSPLGNSSGGAPTLTQCSSKSLSSTNNSAALVEFVNFSEGFATATKLRYAPQIGNVPGPTANPPRATLRTLKAALGSTSARPAPASSSAELTLPLV
jgi:hypothetical protein